MWFDFYCKKKSFWLKSTEQGKTVGLPPTGLLCPRYPVLKLIFTNIQQGEGMNGVGLKGPHSWLSAHLCFGIHTFKMNHPELSSSLGFANYASGPAQQSMQQGHQDITYR